MRATWTLLLLPLLLGVNGSMVVLFNSTARCLDGSPPAMLVWMASGGASRRWVVDFEGGGWCDTWEQCLERSHGPRGSSRDWAVDKKTAGTSVRSRHFGRFNKALLLYCDGASFLGTAGRVEREGKVLHMDGLAIARELVGLLSSAYGLGEASNVLLSGCSAGGVAALALADTVGAMLPKATRFKVAVVSGVFPAWGGLAAAMQRMVALHKVWGGKVHATELLDKVATPAMLLQSSYDSWCLRNIFPHESWVSCIPRTGGEANCSLSQKQQIAGRWYAPFVETLLRLPAVWRARNGLFLHIGATHCLERREEVQGVPHDDALALWFFDVATVSRYIAAPWTEVLL